MNGKEREKKSAEKRTVEIIFVVVMILSFFISAKMGFFLMAGFIAIVGLIGFFHAKSFDAISSVAGTFIFIILIAEVFHAGVAYAKGVPISGIEVNFLTFSENESSIGTGLVTFDITENEVNNNPDLQGDMSWVSVAGSIGILLFTVSYLISPSVGNFPSVVGTLAFIKHQAPVFYNDQSYMIQKGWMTSQFAWAWFWLGMIVILIGFAVVITRHKETAFTPVQRSGYV